MYSTKAPLLVSATAPPPSPLTHYGLVGDRVFLLLNGVVIHADFSLLPIGSRRKATFFLKSRAGQFGKAHCFLPFPSLGPFPCPEAPAFPRSSGEFEQSPLWKLQSDGEEGKSLEPLPGSWE